MDKLYLFRVVTGQMTYMDQRRRYREVYDKQEAEALQARFDALPEEEQQALLRKIGADALESRGRRCPRRLIGFRSLFLVG